LAVDFTWSSYELLKTAVSDDFANTHQQRLTERTEI